MFKTIVKLIENADCIIVLAGAGMSVDSGIPAYRGKDGFWSNELIINNHKINQFDLMSHQSFEENPDKSWSLIGYLIDMFENTTPHKGYFDLLEIIKQKDYFIYTSNIDKQFIKAGYKKDRIVECHGSIYKMQCTDILERENWQTPKINVDYSKFTLNGDYPKCPNCNKPCRPNLFLFGDFFWISKEYLTQQNNYNKWKESIINSNKKIVVIEIGAGKTVNTLRKESANLAKQNIPIIRINNSDPEVENDNFISVNSTAKAALGEMIAIHPII